MHAGESRHPALQQASRKGLALPLRQPLGGVGPGRVVDPPLGEADPTAVEEGVDALQP